MPRYFENLENIRPGSQMQASQISGAIQQTLSRVCPSGTVHATRVGGNMLLRSDPVKNRAGNSIPPLVAVLPALPTASEGYKKVRWGTAGQITGGTGDGQCWEACYGQTAYTPCQWFSTLSGVPV